MCGIFGYVGENLVVENLLQGLKRLEYRGYDSAGIALRARAGELKVLRASGQVSALEASVENAGLRAHKGGLGLAHTRWATHGTHDVKNAHPHVDCMHSVAVVHNGIIENYAELRKHLESQGHRFASDTDSEVLPHLIEAHFDGELLSTVRRVLPMLKGSYAFGAIHDHASRDHIVAARQGSPLVIGLGDGETFLASDTSALLGKASQFMLLEDGEVADISREGVFIFNAAGERVVRAARPLVGNANSMELNGHQHYMAKEIFEQPSALAACLDGRLTPEGRFPVSLPELFGFETMQARFDRVVIAACGTSRHAALLGKAHLEALAQLPCEVEVASEYHTRKPVVGARTLFVTVSQSGETADTLQALRYAKKMGATTIAVCNVEGSSLARESDFVLLTRAGPEIGVASTKAFVTQVAVLEMLALFIASRRGIAAELLADRARCLTRLPVVLANAMPRFEPVARIAQTLTTAKCFLFLGRGASAAVALEGALKLEELSYVPAIGMPAGEMKHGPIALIDESVPSVFVAPKDHTHEKIVSNVQEIRARKGPVIAIATDGDTSLDGLASHVIRIPNVPDCLVPYLATVPLQLLAYFLTCAKGLPVDKPRNLAKSVTVE